jgi:hypothetical protein
MLPLLWVLLGAGIGAGATLVVKRTSTSTLLPGQVWTIVAVAHPTKAWVDISKGAVAASIRTALAGIGVIAIDAFWSGDHQLTVAASVATTTQLNTGITLPIVSEWADQATITSINQAPASVPVMIPRFP